MCIWQGIVLSKAESGETPWEWFGAFKGDADWVGVFEEIEDEREGDGR
jgi:hypothetical protein